MSCDWSPFPLLNWRKVWVVVLAIRDYTNKPTTSQTFTTKSRRSQWYCLKSWLCVAEITSLHGRPCGCRNDSLACQTPRHGPPHAKRPTALVLWEHNKMFFNDNQWIIHKLRASQSMSRLIGVHASSTWKRSVWDRFTSVMVLFNYIMRGLGDIVWKWWKWSGPVESHAMKVTYASSINFIDVGLTW